MDAGDYEDDDGLGATGKKKPNFTTREVADLIDSNSKHDKILKANVTKQHWSHDDPHSSVFEF